VFVSRLQAAREWLDQAPTNNPVDRLNARFIQILIIGYGAAVVFGRAYYSLVEPSSAWPARWTLASATDLASDIAMALASWVGVAVIRRGYFRGGAQFFFCVFVLNVAAEYAVTGYRHAPPDPSPTIMLAIAGVALGSRALWIAYAGLMASFVLGQAADALWLPGQVIPFVDAFYPLPMLAAAYLMVTFAIDTTTRGLRTLLAQSLQRGEELQRTNEQLQNEMEERERTYNQLIHSQKLDAIGRAASGIAHDFDNILNVVLGYAAQREQLADLGTSALINAMEGIELAAIRALTISRKLLNFSRQEMGAAQVLEVATVLSELGPMLGQLMGRHIRLDMQLVARDAQLLLDRGQFELMILNIAANARDAMPDGGTFTIRLQRLDRERVLQLSLADTGVGMSEAVREKVFQPFYTTKPFGQGTGLGLSVVASMVNAANGQIIATAPPTGGTCFMLRLPLHDDALDVRERLSNADSYAAP
jgi:signal transduction histidine kinase